MLTYVISLHLPRNAILISISMERTVAIEILSSTASAIDHGWWPSEDLNLDSFKFSKNPAVAASISGGCPGVEVSSDASE